MHVPERDLRNSGEAVRTGSGVVADGAADAIAIPGSSCTRCRGELAVAVGGGNTSDVALAIISAGVRASRPVGRMYQIWISASHALVWRCSQQRLG